MNHVITQSLADVFSRPADSNYESMEHLLDVAEEKMNQYRVLKAVAKDIAFSVDNGQFNIDVDTVKLPLTNYSLTQVASMAKVQTQMLERLHSLKRDDLVVDNLKTLFPNTRSDTKFILVRDHYDDDGDINSVARAVNGGHYSRLWDYEVFSEMEDFLMTRNFTPSLPTLQLNAMRNGLMHGLNTALFRGDQCSFGFFFIEKDLNGDSKTLGGLKPGMMVFNSEVGARSFGFHTFYYHEASGNIVMWTPANHKRKRFVHRGDIRPAFKEYVNTLEDVANNFQTRYTDDLKTFETASNTAFAVDKNAAIERLHSSFKMSGVSARVAVNAAELKQNSYGDPLSIWNIALGICWEAGQTGRAESLVDDSLVATKMMRSCLRV